MANPRWTPEDILGRMRLGPKESEIYVLGCLERRRVTMGSQQMRAINLVHSLSTRHYETHKKDPGVYKWSPRILVVGGGAGGLTAAAFAAYRGADVTLYERTSALMPNLQNSVRLLHPRLYEWGAPQPFERDKTTDYWRGDRVGLPLLDWQAGRARDVRERLLNEWEGWRNAYEIKVHLETELALSDRESWFRVPGGESDKRFDHVILAVGFGKEDVPEKPKWAETLLGSYWEADTLVGTKGEVLVCGNGDGALTDLFRTLLRNFRQDALTDVLAMVDPDRFLEKTVLSIEENLEDSPDDSREEFKAAELKMAERYLALHAPELDRWTSKNLREGVFVSLAVRPKVGFGRLESAFSRTSFPLNRLFLGSLLRTAGQQSLNIVYTTKELPDIPPENTDTYTLIFRAGVGRKSGNEAPMRRLVPDDTAGDVQSLINANADKRLGDITRQPIWPFFGEAVNPVSMPTADCFVPPYEPAPGLRSELFNSGAKRRNTSDIFAARMYEDVHRFSILSEAFDSVFQATSGAAIPAEDADVYFNGILRFFLLNYDKILLTDAQFWDGRFWSRFPKLWDAAEGFEQDLIKQKVCVLQRKSPLTQQLNGVGRHALFVQSKDGISSAKDFDSSLLGPELSAKYLRWVRSSECVLPQNTEPRAENIMRLFLNYDLEKNEIEAVNRIILEWEGLDKLFNKLNEDNIWTWPDAQGSRHFRPLQQLENPGAFYSKLSARAQPILVAAFGDQRKANTTVRGTTNQLLHAERKKIEPGDPLFAEIGQIQDWFDRAYNRMTAKQQGANVFTSLHLGDAPGSAQGGIPEDIGSPISLLTLGKIETDGFEQIYSIWNQKKSTIGTSEIRKPVTSKFWGTEFDQLLKTLSMATPSQDLRVIQGHENDRVVQKMKRCASIDGFKMGWVGDLEAGEPGETPARTNTHEGPPDENGNRPDEFSSEIFR